MDREPFLAENCLNYSVANHFLHVNNKCFSPPPTPVVRGLENIHREEVGGRWDDDSDRYQAPHLVCERETESALVLLIKLFTRKGGIHEKKSK